MKRKSDCFVILFEIIKISGPKYTSEKKSLSFPVTNVNLRVHLKTVISFTVIL